MVPQARNRTVVIAGLTTSLLLTLLLVPVVYVWMSGKRVVKQPRHAPSQPDSRLPSLASPVRTVDQPSTTQPT